MKVQIFISIIYIFIQTLKSDPKVKDYFISVNDHKCALLSLSADIKVEYETTNGMKSVTFSLLNTSSNQHGFCGTDHRSDMTQFNISLSKDEILVFNFEELKEKIILKNIMFLYHLPSTHFPNATKKGTIVSTSKTNKYLSNSSQFYQCFRRDTFNLSDGVMLSVYSAKIKAFNVINESFGTDINECEKDVTTSTIKPITKKTTTNRPFTTTKKTTTNRPSTTTKKTTTNRPSTTTKKTTTNRPSTTTKKTTTSRRSITTKRTTTSRPSTTTKKTTTNRPSTTTKRTTTNRRSTTTKKTTTNRPSTTTHITSSKKLQTTTKKTTAKTTPTPHLTTISPYDPKFVIQDSNKVCLLLQGKLTISVTYETSKKDIIKIFSITSSNLYIGTCSPKKDSINIYFARNSFFNFTFIKEDKNVKLDTFETHIILSPTYFPDAKYKNQIIKNSFNLGSLYKVSLGKSYLCNRNLTLGNQRIKLEVLDFKFEAFRTANTENFSNDVQTCSKSLNVGLIVGVIVAVIVLIMIIIIVYRVYRIRSKRIKGYQQI